MKHLTMFLALVSTLVAADFPEPVLPAGVGVNIHFTKGRAEDLDLIAAAGFKFIRMDFGWAGVERKKGQYDWSAYDELTANLEKRGLRAIYILDYSNPLYEKAITITDKHTKQERKDLASPQQPESVEAFARWAGAAAKHFRGRRVLWEIWNEPNISFWKPEPDVEQYTTLTLAVCKEIRHADPKATIIAPASSGFPWEFLERFFAADMLRHIDAVSVHPYRGGPPETAAADYQRLRALIARYAPPNKVGMPILSGEWGYPTHTAGVSLDTQAAYLARQQLANLLVGVPLSIWYDWKNDGTDANYNEHNFGTVDHTLKPKPGYVAAQTLTRELAGYRIARRIYPPPIGPSLTPDNDFVLVLINAAGNQKLAAWTLGEPHAVALDLDLAEAEQVTAVQGDGSGYVPKVQRGQLILDLGLMPKYVALRQRTLALAVAAAWSVQPVPNVRAVAGTEHGARLMLKLRNPYPQPLRASLRIEGVGSAWPKPEIVPLPPQRTVLRDFSGTISRCDVGDVSATVRVEFQREASPNVWANVIETRERVEFVLVNPMELVLAPVADGFQLQIANPGRKPFRGTSRVGEATRKVTIATGQTRATLTVPTSAGATGARLINEARRVVVSLLPQTWRAVEVPTFRTVLDGDSKVSATASVTVATAPDGKEAPFPKAFKLDYSFEEGWRFVRCVPDAPRPVVVEGESQALGVWVYGDKSGNSLNLRVTDSSGQTFQSRGPRLDWIGWRWVLMPLGNWHQTPHWGGKNDGVVHGALRWDCPLLLDGHRHKTSGTVYFAGMALVSVASEKR